jgi:hypothetical protein
LSSTKFTQQFISTNFLPTLFFYKRYYFSELLALSADNYLQMLLKLFTSLYSFIFKQFYFSLLLHYSQDNRQVGPFLVNNHFWLLSSSSISQQAGFSVDTI